ncbi:MAG: hypothetical protein LH702_11110 [Phormidesmis sp. CAN_BIN44]|nr:hypothetical protein [Phormidesmis sp. CAN_BIN44]
MVSTPLKLTSANRSTTHNIPSAVNSKPTAQDIYYPGRVVRLSGRLYWVKWCDGSHVCVTARQGLHGGIYQPYPMSSFDFNEWTVPVNHVFLSVV